MHKSLLFSPYSIKSLTLKNRVVVSPMCTYSATEGLANDWHLVHLGTRASGGAGLIMTEATAVEPVGRITPKCTGLWNENQTEAFKPIVEFIHSQTAHAAMQLAHAGRKGSCQIPWQGARPLSPQDGGWEVVGPSPIPFDNGYRVPKSLSADEIKRIIENFSKAAARAHRAGFDVLELHFAHGYLVNQFLSPTSNSRDDSYGGSLENRMKLGLEIVDAVKAEWPHQKPLFARISAVEWTEPGFTIEDSVRFCEILKNKGVDLIDVSTGGNNPKAQIPVAPHFQVTFAEQIKNRCSIPTGAVGLIRTAKDAESILEQKKADLIFLARELLRNPYWAIEAAKELESPLFAKELVQKQYIRAYN
jgi:2,4-dienoyl-CoA reductase-like NADH-dependent reductase (Old Yellow Enzyme family)